MNQSLVLRVRLFGAFRNLSESNEVELKVFGKATIHDIKNELASVLKNTDANFDIGKLLSRSVVADQDHILEDSDVIEHETYLSILPPVCGG